MTRQLIKASDGVKSYHGLAPNEARLYFDALRDLYVVERPDGIYPKEVFNSPWKSIAEGFIKRGAWTTVHGRV
jgi:hypothetical protein